MSGLLVCVMGIDGSGKSTAAHAAIRLLQERGVDASYLWNRWEPKLVRRFTAGAERPTDLSGAVKSDPYERKRRLLEAGWRRHAWLWAASTDYLLTGAPKTRAALRDHAVVVCDRYTPDFIIDQAMNIDGTAQSLGRVANVPWLRAFPRAAGHVLLDVEPEVALARKDDGLTDTVAAEKVALYRAFAKQVGAVVVDGAADAETVADEVAQAIVAAMRGAR